MAARSAYVKQDVNFCPDMSVRQTMLLHAFFRESGDPNRVRMVKARVSIDIFRIFSKNIFVANMKNKISYHNESIFDTTNFTIHTSMVMFSQRYPKLHVLPISSRGLTE